MTIAAGQLVTLTVDKPAAGGRMIARVDGQVVLVSGAIPGERVSARIEKVGKGVAYAQTVGIELASSDRREPFTDALCGGSAYAHIAYPRQPLIKAQIIADGLGRLGRIVWTRPIVVVASPEEGYRMRARLHVQGARIGFFREGSHQLCDARSTRQLLAATCDSLDRLAEALRSAHVTSVTDLELSENVAASERVIHLATAAILPPAVLDAVAGSTQLSGLTDGRHIVGAVHVVDEVPVGAATIRLRRHVLAFFQGNRFLLRDLVGCVASMVRPGDRVVDLYAGVGLFAAAASAAGGKVVAVEGDRIAAQDLESNAASAAVEAVHLPVETFLRQARFTPDVAIVDPPRTGMSADALAGVLRLAPRRLVYVSCDVATLARDARRFVDAGYAIDRIDGFDLFPNTPHVETIVVFERQTAEISEKTA
jgi:23S rRNA (uracil1939-C5)-methyltransferase